MKLISNIEISEVNRALDEAEDLSYLILGSVASEHTMWVILYLNIFEPLETNSVHVWHSLDPLFEMHVITRAQGTHLVILHSSHFCLVLSAPNLAHNHRQSLEHFWVGFLHLLDLVDIHV